MEQRFVVVDIETTGNSVKKGDGIIQFAAVIIENNKIIDRFSSFLNPLKPIPSFIENLTGITNEMIEDAPIFEEVGEKIRSYLHNAYFVAHNVFFDLNFLQEEFELNLFEPFRGPILDTVELARIAFPTASSYKLSDICEELGISHHHPHRADYDAEVTALLLIKILNKLESKPIETLAKLKKLSGSFISDIEDLLNNFIEIKQHSPSRNNEDSVEVFRSIAIQKQREGIKHENAKHKIEIKFHDFIENSSPLSNDPTPTMTFRENQKLMMKDVYYSLKNNQHTLIEAGTGFGKTLAYLIPSFFYANENNQRIIVSTSTTNLQKQIIESEINKLSGMIPFPLTAEIMKGQNHYICLYKFELSLREQESNYDISLTKAQLLIWLTETETGDIDELNIPTGGMYYWKQIRHDHLSNESKENPWFEKCFYQRMKKRVQQANILIVNHSLLVKDLIFKNVLPEYSYVVIDEGHQFIDVATKEAGVQLEYLSIHFKLSKLGTLDDRELLFQVNKLVKKYQLPINIRQLDQLLLSLFDDFSDLFSAIHSFVKKQMNTRDININRFKYRFDKEKENSRIWQGISEIARRIYSTLLTLEKEFVSMAVQNESTMNVLQKKSEIPTLKKFFDYKNFFRDLIEKMQYFFFEQHSDNVIWFEIEVRGAKNAVALYSELITVSEELADSFFAQKNSVVITSATLTVNNSFDFMIEQLGLNDFYPDTKQYSSPFDYEKQMRLIIPNDLPMINESSIEEFAKSISRYISEIAQKTNGKLLILFTAMDMLQETYKNLKGNPALEEFVILAQGVSGGSKSKLTKNFKQFKNAILLGTNSFWEGLDLVGNDLTSLILVRLPFLPPDEPKIAARNERYLNNGNNPFYDYSLPEAIIRFKQGIGRLIRTEQDKGTLYIFDGRIITSHYGKYFLKAIPHTKTHYISLAELENVLDNPI